MRPQTPNFKFPRQAGLSSPPETPTSPSFTFHDPRRHGVRNFSRPVPIPNGNTKGHSHGRHFNYNSSARHEDLSPRSSTSSSDSSGSPPRSISSQRSVGSELAKPKKESPPRTYIRVVTEAKANFTVEEFRESDYENFAGDDEDIIRPDYYEDAESDQSRSVKPSTELDSGMMSGFRNLDCEDSDQDHEAFKLLQRAEKRRKRRSSGSFQKRTLSQSIGSDTDDEDLQPLTLDVNEAGSSARRLRRKLAGERTSLLFDDPPPGIPELEEPESCEEGLEQESQRDRQGFDRELPFYFEDDDMVIW